MGMQQVRHAFDPLSPLQAQNMTLCITWQHVKGTAERTLSLTAEGSTASAEAFSTELVARSEPSRYILVGN